MKDVEELRVFDIDEINEAVRKAREHAAAHGKPLNMARVALNLGITSDELVYALHELEARKGDERAQLAVNAIKKAKQESRADLEDNLADKGNVTGYMFLGKVNHGMIETTHNEVTFKGVRFSGEDEIPE